MVEETKWRPVVRYEGQYEVSSEGTVRRIKTGRIMSQHLSRDGYPRMRLTFLAKGLREVARVHRIVASAFVPNPLSFVEINHIDCIKTNNRASNLEWCTHDHNISHAIRNGLMRFDCMKGKRSGRAILSDELVRRIRSERLAEQLTCAK